MKTTEKIVNAVKKSGETLAELINQTILCLETHFFEKNGKMKAEEGLDLLSNLIDRALKTLKDKIDVEEYQEAKQAIIKAQERLQNGTFGKEVIAKNFSFKSDNVFQEILEKCLAA